MPTHPESTSYSNDIPKYPSIYEQTTGLPKDPLKILSHERSKCQLIKNQGFRAQTTRNDSRAVMQSADTHAHRVHPHTLQRENVRVHALQHRHRARGFRRQVRAPSTRYLRRRVRAMESPDRTDRRSRSVDRRFGWGVDRRVITQEIEGKLKASRTLSPSVRWIRRANDRTDDGTDDDDATRALRERRD